MTARAVRDSLEISGYNLKQHGNPLASIHGVLKRLADSGEAEQIEAGAKRFIAGSPLSGQKFTALVWHRLFHAKDHVARGSRECG